MSCNEVRSTQVSPPSSERKSALGSVPAQTTPYLPTRSTGLTVTAETSAKRIPAPTGSHVLPESLLRHKPFPNVAQYLRSGLCGSTASAYVGKPTSCVSSFQSPPSSVASITASSIAMVSVFIADLLCQFLRASPDGKKEQPDTPWVS